MSDVEVTLRKDRPGTRPYPGGLVQIVKETGLIKRVKPGDTPILELNLLPGSYVASVEMERVFEVYTERKTEDWRWTAYVVHQLDGGR